MSRKALRRRRFRHWQETAFKDRLSRVVPDSGAASLSPCPARNAHQQGRIRQQRHRLLAKQHKCVYAVTGSEALLDFLVRWKWLRDDDAVRRECVERALTLMLDDLARNA
jgi:hypothetical protein